MRTIFGQQWAIVEILDREELMSVMKRVVQNREQSEAITRSFDTSNIHVIYLRATHKK